MKLGYFPGCSLHATAREFDESLRAMAPRLDLELDEVEDWACCGATSAHNTNHLLSVSLPARTLAISEAQGHESLLAPCAACYSRLAYARHALEADPSLCDPVKDAIGREPPTTVQVLSIVRLLADLAPRIREKVATALDGVQIACYYGCLLARPAELNDVGSVEAPTAMEDVVKAVGATPVVWNQRLECCGGGFSLSRKASVVRLSRSIVEDARAAGAAALVVACPMCHLNLDFRQKAIARRSGERADMPVFFLTQLVGLALGMSATELGLGRHYVSTADFVARLSGQEGAAESASEEIKEVG